MYKSLFLFFSLSLLIITNICAQVDEKKVYNIDFSDFNKNPKEPPKQENNKNLPPKTALNLISFKRKKPSLSNIDNAGFILNTTINSDNFGKLKARNRDIFGKKNDVAHYKIKKLPKQLKNIEGGAKLIFTDQNLGEIITQSEYLDIYYRDHGQIDGDIIKININEAPFVGKVVLDRTNKSARLYLKQGFTKIDLYSVFDGRLYPNTVEWVIKDDREKTIANNVLSVSKGFKGTIVVIKN